MGRACLSPPNAATHRPRVHRRCSTLSRGGAVMLAGSHAGPRKEPSPYAGAGAIVRVASFLRVPDQRIDIGVCLTRGTPEIGVERLAAELWNADRERQVLLARDLPRADPTRADLDPL